MRYSLLVMAAGAREPWNSTDSTRGDELKNSADNDFSRAEKWEIERCLNCPFPECHDCFDAYKAKFGYIRQQPKKRRKKKRKCSNTKNTKPGKTGSPAVTVTSEPQKPVQYSVWDLSPK